MGWWFKDLGSLKTIFAAAFWISSKVQVMHRGGVAVVQTQDNKGLNKPWIEKDRSS